MMTIRLAQNADLDSILKVVETAFSDEENKVIKNLVLELSTETASPSIKSLVAEVDNQVIGYVSYSPISLKSDSSIRFQGDWTVGHITNYLIINFSN